MKTLIVYTSKHGATRQIAQQLSRKLPATTLCDLKSGQPPALTDFGTIIIGSPIYAGALSSKIKKFISANHITLQGKNLGLFLSGLTKNEEVTKKLFTANFPPALLKAARVQMFLGGIFDPKQANPLERLIIKAITKQTTRTNTIKNDQITTFANLITTK